MFSPRFFIHQTYAPNNVIDVSQKPFHLIRRGWGEFPARIQIHFKNPANKPVDVVHNLKLDKTYTGLQTLGSETLIDVWLKTAAQSQEPKPASASDSARHLDQNFTIVEDKSLLAGDSVVVSINTKQLKRTASAAAVSGGDSERKKARLSDTTMAAGNVLKDIVSARPSVGASLLKKIH